MRRHRPRRCTLKPKTKECVSQVSQSKDANIAVSDGDRLCFVTMELKGVTKSHAYIIMTDYFISSCDIVVGDTIVGVWSDGLCFYECRILFSVYSIGAGRRSDN
jgi:hypothetical protein